MKVYILHHHYNHECDRIMGIFDTYEKAEEALIALGFKKSPTEYPHYEREWLTGYSWGKDTGTYTDTDDVDIVEMELNTYTDYKRPSYTGPI